MVTIKYILIVLFADDEGEGGTFALFTLISRYVCESCRPLNRLWFTHYFLGTPRRARSPRRTVHQNGALQDRRDASAQQNPAILTRE
jgi:hypothetical protein